MKSATVSAKIPEKLRRRLREHGVTVSEVIRRALERELHRREREDLKRRADEISFRLRGKVSRKDIVSAIRSTREGR